MTAQFLQASPRRSTRRKAVNATVSPEAVAEARELGINLSEAFQNGLDQAIKQARAERWLAENREAIESSNAWVEKHGLPLAKYRLF
ncbi:MAG: type II toxin-antitoxin system CcdA family antitoxin [Candidatus Andeanibacterium colombiense]|uniref:Type II toxin-antitoxin system CcdA family antitoxin n=1 Tax=Candidatus Andeanibacterium colombiense TaxID=3121345 RepID=A0AAJ5X9R9_9SPHN|nr:MAG: type II toxin-antitoxin system CcdA family antitoxin [Sphingomonadaceae bacterium]